MQEEGKEQEKETTQLLGAEVVKLKLIAWDDTNHPGIHVTDRDAYVAFSTAKLVNEWFGNDTGAGAFNYHLYTSSAGMFLEMVWEADSGYSWNEMELYKLVFPGEDE